MAQENIAAGHRLRLPVAMLCWDIGLPVIAYFAAKLLGASAYTALLSGTVVSGLRVGWVALRQRRLDPFASFLLVLFGAGLLLTFVTGDARFVLAKDAAVSLAASLVMLGSCLIGRPIAYYAAKRFAASSGRTGFDRMANTDAMRTRWYRVTLVWGCGLLADAALRIACVYLLPIDTAATASQALMLVVCAALLIWTIRSAKTKSTVDA
ncbi:VC0807 family protein [Amycolatopsis minnesotensis]|uniref:Intracellular septation protein A n=1 Tax=Amycolatopsis minnesotensis TaxID=337894 RepID=A0ABN2QAD0_9PSEU